MAEFRSTFWYDIGVSFSDPEYREQFTAEYERITLVDAAMNDGTIDRMAHAMCDSDYPDIAWRPGSKASEKWMRRARAAYLAEHATTA